jgi:hypothetical protein
VVPEGYDLDILWRESMPPSFPPRGGRLIELAILLYLFN